MYCGNCLRDNALVGALRRLGHAVTMLPLYLPLKTDERDQSEGAPVFFGGINVYLEQKAPLFRRLPRWLHDLLDSPRLLRLVGKAAARTRPEDVGELTVSMLRGEMGNQAREIDVLLDWLVKHERPEVISLSNALLVGLARRLRQQLGARVVVTVQGEEAFLDALPPADRDAAWAILAERLAETDLLIAPSQYYATRMSERLRLPRDRFQVVPNGIQLAGWRPADAPPDPPVLGFLARMCPEKGLDLLVDAYLILRRKGRIPHLRLAIAGSFGPGDANFVETQKRRLQAEGVMGEVDFQPNLDHGAKQEFLRGLSVFSVPAHYGEAFGLYLLESMAAGIPVVQPATGAFPEILGDTGAGLISKAGDAADLAERIEEVLSNRDLARRLGEAGIAAVADRYNADAVARHLSGILANLLQTPASSAP